MAALTLAYRQSATDSVDDNRSRYIPSSVYSGPGPDTDAIPPVQPVQPVQPMYAAHGAVNGGHNGYPGSNGFPVPVTPRPRTSEAVNVSDPVAMHLLTETALGDSRNFNIVSLEELEHLKVEKNRLGIKIQATKRKIALETKLRDAAQSLNRLYSKVGKDVGDGKGHRRNHTGSSKGSMEILHRAEDEYLASQKKIEELSASLEVLQARWETAQTRILEHTAGILQITHRGLKKNRRKHELPRSPESMASPGQRNISRVPQLDEFDERSFYPVPDYVNEFIGASPMTPMLTGQSKTVPSLPAMGAVAEKLQVLSHRLHGMASQLQSAETMAEPPVSHRSDRPDEVHAQIDAHVAFLTQGLDALSAAQQRSVQESSNVTGRIHEMLERTKSVSRGTAPVEDVPRGHDLSSQLAFSMRVLEQLHGRVEALVEQKDILTRQIQQQRELNSKSDAERDAQINEMADELTAFQRKHALSEEEAGRAQHEIAQLMDELDRARDTNQLLGKQRGMDDDKAWAAEREDRQRVERDLGDQIEAKHKVNEQLQASLKKLHDEVTHRAQQHDQQVSDLTKSRDLAETTAKRHQAESEKLLEQMASIRTELVMAQAELDGAYGSRAQRAADVSSNPAVQKQLDELQSTNAQLQHELQETIEDYEQMTKASIEFEKERDTWEASIDQLRDRCESLETRLNEEKLKTLGAKSAVAPDTTSTTVLKNEFKKMMRDSKTESMKAIRYEQEERRKLEAVIRQLKKAGGLSIPTRVPTK